MLNIAKAILKAQKEMGNAIKDSKNPFCICWGFRKGDQRSNDEAEGASQSSGRRACGCVEELSARASQASVLLFAAHFE